MPPDEQMKPKTSTVTRSTEEQVDHVKALGSTVLRNEGVPDWDSLAEFHKCGKEGHYEAMTLALRTALDLQEKTEAVLRDRIEDLCREIEFAKKRNPVFLMGPGSDE